MVPTFTSRPFDRLGAQLYPCSLATDFHRGLLVSGANRPKSSRCITSIRTATQSISTRFELVITLRSFTTLVPHVPFWSCLPNPGHLVVLTSSGFIRAAYHPCLRFQVQTAHNFIGLLLQVQAGVLSPPLGLMAPRGERPPVFGPPHM